MDSYSLADILIKAILILFGVFMILKGKNAKSDTLSKNASVLSPSVLIILGVILMGTNGYSLFELLSGT